MKMFGCRTHTGLMFGVIAGLLIGSAAGALIHGVIAPKSNIKRKACKLLDAFGDALGDVSDWMK